jgi:hypothetical protein
VIPTLIKVIGTTVMACGHRGMPSSLWGESERGWRHPRYVCQPGCKHRIGSITYSGMALRPGTPKGDGPTVGIWSSTALALERLSVSAAGFKLGRRVLGVGVALLCDATRVILPGSGLAGGGRVIGHDRVALLQPVLDRGALG